MELLNHGGQSLQSNVFERKEYLNVLELAELAWSPLADTLNMFPATRRLAEKRIINWLS